MKRNLLSKKNCIRVIGMYTAVLTAFIFIYDNSSIAQKNHNDIPKSYIVVTNSKKSQGSMKQKIETQFHDEVEALEESNVLVADLTNEEVNAIERNDEVLFVEEDIELNANSVHNLQQLDSLGRTPKEVNALKKEHRKARKKILNRKYVAPGDYEWNMKAVAANEVETEETARVKVAVLDSGVDMIRGIDLAGSVNLVPEENGISPLFLDMSGHGTSIASIIAGNPQNAVQGINPNAELYSVKVLDENNEAPLSRIIEGIYWCIENEMQIINMSFGTSVYSRAFEMAIEEADQAGILMIGAAGNGSADVEYPAAFPQVMAVAATDTEAGITEFSNSGDELELAAPGENVKALTAFGATIVTCGTSIAAAHATGAASLLWQENTSKLSDFIRRLMSASAKDIKNSEDCGLLDVEFALKHYSEFEKKFQKTETGETNNMTENEASPETFSEIAEDEEYAAGSWRVSNGTHEKLASFDGTGTSVTKTTLNIIKKGAIFPDGFKTDGMKGEPIPFFHGASSNSLNPIANYELMTRIALAGGNTSSFTNWKAIPGMDSMKTFNAIKAVFVADRITNKSWYQTWTQVFAHIKKESGGSAENNATNRRRFIWGMALHHLSDMFAHFTYRKSNGKALAHDTYAKDDPHEIMAADRVDIVKRRYEAAKWAVDSSVWCLELGTFGNWIEIDDALQNAPESNFAADDRFTKLRLLECGMANSGGWSTTSAYYQRFKAANREVLLDGYYRINNLNSKLCLDVPYGTTTNGIQIEQHPFNNQSNQIWQVEKVGNSIYTIRPSYALGKALDVYGGGNTNNTKVGIWDSPGNGNSANRWKIHFGEQNGEWGYRLLSECSSFSKALVIERAVKESGGKCIQYEDNGTSNGTWLFKKL